MPEKEFKIWLEDGIIIAWRDASAGGIAAFRVVLLAEIDGEIHCVAHTTRLTASRTKMCSP